MGYKRRDGGIDIDIGVEYSMYRISRLVILTPVSQLFLVCVYLVCGNHRHRHRHHVVVYIFTKQMKGLWKTVFEIADLADTTSTELMRKTIVWTRCRISRAFSSPRNSTATFTSKHRGENFFNIERNFRDWWIGKVDFKRISTITRNNFLQLRCDLLSILIFSRVFLFLPSLLRKTFLFSTPVRRAVVYSEVESNSIRNIFRYFFPTFWLNWIYSWGIAESRVRSWLSFLFGFIFAGFGNGGEIFIFSSSGAKAMWVYVSSKLYSKIWQFSEKMSNFWKRNHQSFKFIGKISKN